MGERRRGEGGGEGRGERRGGEFTCPVLFELNSKSYTAIWVQAILQEKEQHINHNGSWRHREIWKQATNIEQENSALSEQRYSYMECILKTQNHTLHSFFSLSHFTWQPY